MRKQKLAWIQTQNSLLVFTHSHILQHRARYTVKPVLSGHSKRRPKLVFKTNFGLMQVKIIAECSPWSILQYVCPSLSYHLSIGFLFFLFLSGRLRPVLQ